LQRAMSTLMAAPRKAIPSTAGSAGGGVQSAITKGVVNSSKTNNFIQLDNKITYSAAKAKYWRGITGNNKALIGSDGKSMVLHHPFGRIGDNLYRVRVMTQTQHMKFHNAEGYYFYNGIIL